MSEATAHAVKQAVEAQHGGTATLVQSVPVDERHDGNPVWQGVVHVFDLAGHPKASRAYAWSSERDDGKRRFYAVLHMGPVTSPAEAVRAAIVAEQKARQPRQTVADNRPICVHCGQRFDWNAGSVTNEAAVCDVCLGD